MRVIESKTGRRTGTLLLFVLNTLPIAGLIGFGWRPFQALFVYWVEIGVTLLGYYVVVLFGQRDSKPEEKGGGSYPGPVPLPVPDGSFRPIQSLPPLRYRNARYIPASVPLVAIIWFLLSRAFLDFPNTGVMIEGRPAVESIAEYIAISYTLEGLMTAAIASVIQLFLIGRDFLSRRLVDRYSAAMLAELPIRIVGVWFVVLLLLVPVYAGTIVFDIGRGVVGWGFFLLLFGAKLAIDLALLRLRYEPNPGLFTRLFVPNTRETE